MKTLIAHPTTQHAHHLARELESQSLLLRFHSGGTVIQDSPPHRLLTHSLPERYRRQLRNRTLSPLSPGKIKTHPWSEIKMLMDLVRGASPNTAIYRRNRKFQNSIPARDLQEADVVIGYDTSSWILAETCRELGKPFILDRTIAYLEPTKNTSTAGQQTKEAEIIEHDLATAIMVPSSYTKKSLLHSRVASEKIIINPYGVDIERFHPPEFPPDPGEMHFLFAGTLGNRKGVPDLIECWNRISPATARLSLSGSPQKGWSPPKCSSPSLHFIGSTPRQSMPQFYRKGHVLILPTYSEGFALVILEALASGLPVITTTSSGAEDIIEDGVDGFIIKPGDLNALTDRIEFFLTRRDQWTTMSNHARVKAEHHSWTAYGNRWAQFLNSI